MLASLPRGGEPLLYLFGLEEVTIWTAFQDWRATWQNKGRFDPLGVAYAVRLLTKVCHQDGQGPREARVANLCSATLPKLNAATFEGLKPTTEQIIRTFLTEMGYRLGDGWPGNVEGNETPSSDA